MELRQWFRTRAARFAVLLVLPASGIAEPVWLVSNGFHTSVAVRRKDLLPEVARLVDDPRADHLLIGWGAAIYYTAPRKTPLTLCRVIFLPTASAVHIVPVRGPLRSRFPNSDILRFAASPRAFRDLVLFLGGAIQRDAAGRPLLLGPGSSPGSRFYAGSETFWFPVTCNVWSARALRCAGVPVSLARAVAAESLVRQVRRHAEREATRRQPLDRF